MGVAVRSRRRWEFLEPSAAATSCNLDQGWMLVSLRVRPILFALSVRDAYVG